MTIKKGENDILDRLIDTILAYNPKKKKGRQKKRRDNAVRKDERKER